MSLTVAGMQMPGFNQHSWHDQAADAPLRANLTSHIIQIFAKKRGQQMQNWGQRLGDFVRRLEDQLYATARSKEEYMNLETLEQRLQLVARSMAPSRANGSTPAAPQQQQHGQQQALPPGMMPNPGQPQLPPPGMAGSGSNMQFPQGQSAGPAGMPGFMPTAGTNGAFGQSDDMHLRNPALANGGASGSPGVDGSGNGNPGMMHGFGHSGVAANMLRNGQRDMSFGLQGQQGSLNHATSLPRTSMNGMPSGSGTDMNSHGGGMVPFMPNPGMGASSNGMIPVQNGMHQPMLNMPNTAPSSNGVLPGAGSGMIPVNGMMGSQSSSGMMQQAGSFNMGGLGNFNMPGSGSRTAGSAAPQAPGMMGTGDMSENSKTQYVQKQQRWLLFLRHCAKCRQSETECQLQAQCKFGKQLWQHILHCAVQSCPYPRCSNSKDLLKHHQKCQSPQCPICAPVKEYVRKTRLQQQQAMQAQSQQPQQSQPQQPMLPAPQPGMGGHPGLSQPGNLMMNGQGMPGFAPMPPMPPVPTPQPPAGNNKRPHGAMTYPQQGAMQQSMRGMQANGQQLYGMQQGAEQQPPQPPKRIKTDTEGLGKNTYTSLLETFTADQIRQHKEHIFQAASQQRSQQIVMSETDLCTVCRCTKLQYEPPVLYCSQCGLKIKRSSTYWSTPPEQQDSTQKGCWCHQCYGEAKDKLPLFGLDQSVKKADLVKRKNDEEIEEPWVQCDMCESWVHQICGLFNKGRNTNATHYLCPDCLIKCDEMGKRQRIEQRPQAMLECKDLPHCELSKFLENRMLLGLQHERIGRAQKENRQPHEVPTAEGLCVRVVNNVMKKCEVKPRFLEAFQGERGDVSAFPYRQRVILLFQNLDGVDVCLFTMYVQEYGNDCPEPNRNCVYLSYLDSVKYFRPEVNAVPPNPVPGTGNQAVALRTFVYHQILIGYLSYVKMLGFTQMYIWACPPMQGDDYILYCHPHKQKTPRSDRLRNWYLDMLRQAKSEGIVVHLTTLWDTYFPGGKDHRLERCSATTIPYLEGDYWPGEAENQLTTISEGQRQANKNSKGGAAARSAKGKRYGSGPASTDETLMERLGEILGGNMKEDFIVVHMQEVCTFCRKHVLGGNNIYRFRSMTGVPLKAPAERKFEGIKLEPGPNVPTAPVTSLSICESCFTEESVRYQAGLKLRLPANVTPADLILDRLEQEEAQNIKDPDPDLENEFFETRQSFLSLCQGNHYQFDTLRRAKHSSMMVLYHLHNPSEPAFTSTCNLCQRELEAGTGFRCTKCQDFDICADCKNTRGHEHPMVPSRHYDETRMRMTEQERRERNENLQRTMALLVHACSCQSPQCTSTSCRKVQALFQHAVQCQVKIHGGCVTCKKMWCLLTLHAKSCTKADCQVPRCKDFKEMRRRQTARQEDKRRKAYQNMLRSQHVLQQQGK